MTLPAGTKLGPYEILRRSARRDGGGVPGAGYASFARGRDQSAAGASRVRQERLRRFEKEARAASALNHPNIVTIYDIGSDGVSYIAMELVEGRTLRELLASGPLPLRSCSDRAPDRGRSGQGARSRDRASGPEARERDGDEGRAGQDPGLRAGEADARRGRAAARARAFDDDRGDSRASCGTVGYMSPEQASGQAVDFRSDQFSFGSILYEMATGKRAFQRRTEMETLAAILDEEPEPIAKVTPEAGAASLDRGAVPRQGAGATLRRHAGSRSRSGECARPHFRGELRGTALARADGGSLVPVFGAIGAAVALILAGAFLQRWSAREPRPAPSVLSPTDVSPRQPTERALRARRKDRRLRRRLGGGPARSSRSAPIPSIPPDRDLRSRTCWFPPRASSRF